MHALFYTKQLIEKGEAYKQPEDQLCKPYLYGEGVGYGLNFVGSGGAGCCCGDGYIYFGKHSSWPLGTVC